MVVLGYQYDIRAAIPQVSWSRLCDQMYELVHSFRVIVHGLPAHMFYRRRSKVSCLLLHIAEIRVARLAFAIRIMRMRGAAALDFCRRPEILGEYNAHYIVIVMSYPTEHKDGKTNLMSINYDMKYGKLHFKEGDAMNCQQTYGDNCESSKPRIGSTRRQTQDDKVQS